ncbi:hypothetical protein EV122DRAFT_285790 [Schizophyllum commune]
MSQDFDTKLLAVRDAISKRPPFVSGTLDVPDVDLKLYFGDVVNYNCMNLGQATEDKLASLVATCQPATFGLNQEDVLDETYRKAITLDNTMFASLLKPAQYGLINTIRDQLLQEGAESTKQVAHEVYRLNVYETGSFFKPHKDTPRSERMFGSLVIIFPTPHEGGALVLRENGREWTFDYAAELIGDGGRRDVLPAIPRSVEDEDARLRGALQAFLQDPKLLPEGGYLAFGLRFMYPLQRDKKADLQDLLPHLKGGDAMVVRVCQSLGLAGKLMLVYKDDQSYEDRLAHYYNSEHSSEDDHDDDTDGESEAYLTEYHRPREAHVCVAVDHFTKIDAVEDTTFALELVDDEGGERIRPMGSKPLTRAYWARVGRPAPVIPSTEAFWVTQLASLNSVKQTYMAYGNQSDMRHTYGYLAYFVKIDRDAQGN